MVFVQDNRFGRGQLTPYLKPHNVAQMTCGSIRCQNAVIYFEFLSIFCFHGISPKPSSCSKVCEPVLEAS